MIFGQLFELKTSIYSYLLGCVRLGYGRSHNEFIAIMQELKLAYPKYIDQVLPASGLAEEQG